jgi:formylglycine-generating enzyme required for sulfatase activity
MYPMRRSWFPFLAAPAIGVLLLAACGRVVSDLEPGPVSPRDANKDAGKDSGKLGGPEDCDMPASLPDHPDAKPCVDRPGAPCVPGGWFCLAKWTPYWSDKNPDSCITLDERRAPKKLVWLDSYQLDAYEVTNESYQSYRLRYRSAAPPDYCQDTLWFDPMLPPPKEKREPSGWEGGKPQPDRMKHPVACLPRVIASDYCKERGGRLPTAIEYLRAGQREAPGLQRFPWGNDQPLVEAGVCTLKPGFSTFRAPVDSFEGDRGPYGHYALASNVGEWVSTCREELDAADLVGATPSVVKSQAQFNDACERSVLIAGLPGVLAQTLAEIRFNAKARAENLVQVGGPSLQVGFSGLQDFDAGPRGVRFASNRVGFRCAYDLP